MGLLPFSAAGSGARKAKGGSSEGKMSRREEGKGFIGEEVGKRDEGGGRDEERGAASFEEGLGAKLNKKGNTGNPFFSSWASYHVVRRKRGEEGRGRKE